jgi:hypothetical protein
MPSTPSPLLSLNTIQDISNSSLCASAFLERVTTEGLTHVRRAAFPAGRPTIPDLMTLGEVELAELSAVGPAVVLRPEPQILVHLSFARGNGSIAVAGGDRSDVDRLTASLVAELSEPNRRDPDLVPVVFWAHNIGGPMTPRHHVSTRPWPDVARNYAPATRSGLDALMRATEPGPGGLILWHGEPGTGKSHALRTLIREWRGWCDAHVITDPEVLLGGQTSYLMSALLRGDHDHARLLVLEDAGELLAADARAVAGQALSRLLNVSDGLLGAGLRVVVLVTTNEPLRRMHPAVVRPGRCWAQVEFSRLPATEADAWVSERSDHAGPGNDATLAELFALVDGRVVAERQPIGFGT